MNWKLIMQAIGFSGMFLVGAGIYQNNDTMIRFGIFMFAGAAGIIYQLDKPKKKK